MGGEREEEGRGGAGWEGKGKERKEGRVRGRVCGGMR